jgi:hypothetical protein
MEYHNSDGIYFDSIAYLFYIDDYTLDVWEEDGKVFFGIDVKKIKYRVNECKDLEFMDDDHAYIFAKDNKNKFNLTDEDLIKIETNSYEGIKKLGIYEYIKNEVKNLLDKKIKMCVMSDVMLTKKIIILF